MTTPKYPHVAALIYEQPWAILPGALSAIVEVIELRLDGGRLSRDEIDERLAAAREGAGSRSGARRSSGVAVVPVYGVLAHRANLFSETSGGTSVEGLRKSFREALVDPEVGSIVLDVDSPGGAIDGIPELADEIRSARGQKPIVAVANTLMASAAYWLASAADEIVATPSALVGSVGVYATHTDFSAMDQAMGVRTTLISAGKYKTEGNEFEPLGDEARSHIQSIVDDAYGLFVDAVAKGRGASASAVREGYGEGRVLPPRRARAAGMVDRVDTLEGTIRRLSTGRGPAMRSAQHVTSRSAADHLDALVMHAPGLVAGPIRRHKTDTTDDPWDGPMMDARCPADEAHLAASHAWRDDEGDPDAKGSYKFGHHMISADGDVGPANTNACSSGIAVLNGGRGGSNIPDEDRPGVHGHLAGHIEDSGKDAPPLQGHGNAPAAEVEIARERAAADTRTRVLTGRSGTR